MPAPAAAQDAPCVPSDDPSTERVCFPAVTNVTYRLANQIDLEINHQPATERGIDIGIWTLTEGYLIQKLQQAVDAGVPVRVLGDHSMFDYAAVKLAYYRLACWGVPIRLRYNPTWYPELMHWKTTIFRGQGMIEFGSANYAPVELAPVSNNNYDDETAMFTGDPALVAAFETRFDWMWNDTLPYSEGYHSQYGDPPYLVNWYDDCPLEANCDFQTWWPQHMGQDDYCPGGPRQMSFDGTWIQQSGDTSPVIWGQGSYPGDFNSAMINAINAEPTGGHVDLAVYRLSEPGITDALINAAQSRQVRVRLTVDGNQYEGSGGQAFPEYELTHYNIDRLWASGLTNIVLSSHPWIDGVSHLKTLITSASATLASSNFTQHWQRDHDYFVASSGPGSKPVIYNALESCFQSMFTDTAGTCVPNGSFPHFIPFTPSPAVWEAGDLVSPNGGDTVSTTPTLVWNRASWAVYYDVYLSEDDQSHWVQVATVNHDLSETYPPQATYSFTTAPLDPGRTYYWQIRVRTLVPGVVTTSAISYFATSGG